MSFSVVTREADGYPVVAVSGEVDVSSSPQLQRELSAAFDGGAASVVVDLSEVDFLDSTGLGALVSARASAAGAGGTVAVVCTQGRLLKLFTITGLDTTFVIHPTVAQAAAALAQTA